MLYMQTPSIWHMTINYISLVYNAIIEGKNIKIEENNFGLFVRQ